MKHSDYITHINNPEDKIYLKSKHFPVNMRLFKTSPEYRRLILAQCSYIRMLCSTKMEGYKLPHGMSSANAGLAFNIIAYTIFRNTPRAYVITMINPEILEYGDNKIITESNCGSLTLPEPIKVIRPTKIKIKYFNEEGVEVVRVMDNENGIFTIQHEVDHNNGILITDRKA